MPISFPKHKHNSLFSSIDDNAEETATAAIVYSNSTSSNQAENSLVETGSLLQLVWKLIQSLTLRQKYAFILHQPDFIIDFISAGCCSIKELADYFEMFEDEFAGVMEDYPLPDERIAELLTSRSGKKISAQNVRKARSQAKAKIAAQLSGYISDGRLPVKGKT